MEYFVTMFIDYCQSVTVEAEDEDDAIEKAWNEFNIAKAEQMNSSAEVLNLAEVLEE